MSKENILKHLRCPDPTGQEDWEKRIEQAYHGTHSRWTENLHQSFLGFAIDAICDRCEALEAENAELLAALVSFRNLARLAAEKWDADEDARVGKLLLAMSGFRTGYRADIDAIHETIAKAKGTK